jgi:integrase
VSRGRPFGSIRVLPSGRVQVRYYGPDGLRHKARMTFGTRTEARRWLSMMEADLARGRWNGDDSDGERLESYAARWIVERPGLSERSIALYRGLLRLHITPRLGHVGLRKITPALVRTWRQGLLDAGVGASTVSKAYRLLRAVLNTAADDELIRRNPCRIKGAGVEHPEERPVLTLFEVMALAEAIDRRYRMLVLLAVFASLRWGELVALRKSDFDLDLGLVRIERSVSLVGARQVIKKPKTPAGVRTVALPMWLVSELEQHFSDYSEQLPDGRVFVGPYGVTPGRANFSRIWARALTRAGLSRIHVHDLHHTGNHLAALAGASTRELMGRMGHVSVNAALVYQHRTASRDRAIADSLDAMVAALSEEASDRSGHVGGTASG